MLERMLAKRHIAALDLTVVRMKVRERLGWSFEKTDEVELAYRRFLYALARNRTGFSISPPSQDVDEFWHEHILNTRKYREDCDRIFGHYVDHTPGLSAEDQFSADARRRQVYDDDSIDSIYFDGRDYGSGDTGGEAVVTGGTDWTSSISPLQTGGDEHHAHGGHADDATPSSDSPGFESDSSGDSSGSDSSADSSADSGGGDSGGGGDGGSSCGGSSCGGSSCGGGGE